jgi:outer membrane protein OmpA-like peptidoglycan-associated protein
LFVVSVGIDTPEIFAGREANMNSRCVRIAAALTVLLGLSCLNLAAFGSWSNRPLAVACAVAKPSILQEDTTTIRANAAGSGRRELTYAWTASGGKISGTGDTAAFDAINLAPGKYTVTVTVSDKKHQASCSIDITVLKRNHPPTVACEPAATVSEGESVTLNATASDSDDDPLTYSWDIDGERLAATGPQISFGAEGRKPGTYNARVGVRDGEATATCATRVTVQERAKPTIECLTTTMDVASGGSIELRVRSADPNGGKLTYSWSSNGGTLTGRGETAIFNAAGVGAGTYRVNATASNPRGGKASCSMMMNVSEDVSLTRHDCGYFAPGNARLDGCAKIILDSLAMRMKSDPKLRANIIGYTDRSSLERSERNLGEDRARAAADYLEKQGVEASRLMITNGGTNNPVSQKTTEAGRALNRRVEIELSVR